MRRTFTRPFTVARRQNQPCLCVKCGLQLSASYEISQFPHRYIPSGWFAEAKTNALFCAGCHHEYTLLCDEQREQLYTYFDDYDVVYDDMTVQTVMSS